MRLFPASPGATATRGPRGRGGAGPLGRCTVPAPPPPQAPAPPSAWSRPQPRPGPGPRSRSLFPGGPTVAGAQDGRSRSCVEAAAVQSRAVGRGGRLEAVLAQVTGGRGGAAGPRGVPGPLAALPGPRRLPIPAPGWNRRRSGPPPRLSSPQGGRCVWVAHCLTLTSPKCILHGGLASPGGEG